MYEQSVTDPSAFWGDIASGFHWERKWDTVVRSNFAKSAGTVETAWFEGGKVFSASGAAPQPNSCVAREVARGLRTGRGGRYG